MTATTGRTSHGFDTRDGAVSCPWGGIRTRCRVKTGRGAVRFS